MSGLISTQDLDSLSYERFNVDNNSDNDLGDTLASISSSISRSDKTLGRGSSGAGQRNFASMLQDMRAKSNPILEVVAKAPIAIEL
jgi:hypothetical protein